MKFGLLTVVAAAFALSACDMGHKDMGNGGDTTPIYTKDGMVVPMEATVVDDVADAATDMATDAVETTAAEVAEEATDMATDAVSDAM